MAIQVQIQALLAEGVREGERVAREVGRERGIKVAKPQIFDGTLLKVAGFIMACKLYIRIRMRKKPVEG